MAPTEHQNATTTKLKRISWLSARNHEGGFGNLMHHVNLESLSSSFNELSGRKAVGLDKVTKDEYGEKLSENLKDLVERMKRMAYRPKPTRRVYIPKEGKPGATRPLDIANFEDKLVQRTLAKVVEAVYEPVFLDCSYGFRPGRGCHDAIKDLYDHLAKGGTSVIIDVDLENYFGSIRSDVLLQFLEKRIRDKTLIRYIARTLKAGVLADGELVVSEEGVPQGSPLSPVLANIVAHYVIDEWFETTVKLHCSAAVRLLRYADDLVICCNLPEDAARVKLALQRRLAKFGLKMNVDKTRTVEFSRSKLRSGKKQGTFDYLGFTFYLGRSRKGWVTPKLKTSRKRMKSKLRKVKEWVKSMRDKARPVDLWKSLCLKLAGHIEYYAVSFNLPRVQAFIDNSVKIVWRWLNRRGGRKGFTWRTMQILRKQRPLPAVRLRHTLFSWSRPA